MVIWVTRNGVKEQTLARMIANRLTDSGLSTFIFHIDEDGSYISTIERLRQLQQLNSLYAVVASLYPLRLDDLTLNEHQLITVHCLNHGEQPREDAHLNLQIDQHPVPKCVAQAILFIHKRLGCFTG